MVRVDLRWLKVMLTYSGESAKRVPPGGNDGNHGRVGGVKFRGSE